MRQEVFEIVQKMDKDNIRTQMALQCAPLITGLKVANLLIIPSTVSYTHLSLHINCHMLQTIILRSKSLPMEN